MNVRFFRMFKSPFVILGWATSIAALTLATIFQGLLLPKNINGGGLYNDVVNGNPLGLLIFYLGNFGICVIAAMVIGDPGKALISFFPSFIGAAIVTYLVLALPDLLGLFPFLTPGVLQESASVFALTAFFPVLLLVNLAGTVLGIGLSERFL